MPNRPQQIVIFSNTDYHVVEQEVNSLLRGREGHPVNVELSTTSMDNKEIMYTVLVRL